jgi:hypothetical protein
MLFLINKKKIGSKKIMLFNTPHTATFREAGDVRTGTIALILPGTLANPVYTEVYTGRKNRKMATPRVQCSTSFYKVILHPAVESDRKF